METMIGNECQSLLLPGTRLEGFPANGCNDRKACPDFRMTVDEGVVGVNIISGGLWPSGLLHERKLGVPCHNVQHDGAAAPLGWVEHK